MSQAEAARPPGRSIPSPRSRRWPAEWEPHAATWLSWPHNVETWPGCLELARAAIAQAVAALAPHERVCIHVADQAMEASARAALAAVGVGSDADVHFFEVPTDDAWVRDHGPIFVFAESDAGLGKLVVDFGFDAWGGKYPPWSRDDAVPEAVARALALPREEAGFVLEGGSIEGNGRGCLLTTESCLLAANREAGRTRAGMEERLARTLGASKVLWLGEGIEGDDTDGHVDDLTRFVAPDAVVTCVEPDAGDPNHAPLAENLRRLRGLRDQDGRPLAIATLPMPPAVRFAGQRCPASYANFYIANGVVLVPTFGVASDARALAILRECFGGSEAVARREVVGIPSRDLVVGLGALHCLTLQEPR